MLASWTDALADSVDESSQWTNLLELTPPQRLALADHGRRKAYLCGRRSGKTRLLGAEFLLGAEEAPGETSCYIALTKGHARRNLGAALEQIKRATGVGGRLTELDGQLHWLHHNGHKIWLAGCQHKVEAEKFRGDYYTKVGIDECASFPLGLLEYLVDDVLRWALVDKQAPLIAAGTPGVIPVGFFWEITEGGEQRAKWPVHSWSLLDNTFVPHGGEELISIMDERGEPVEPELREDLLSLNMNEEETLPEFLKRCGVSAGIQREFFYQWVKDEDSLCYPWNPEINRCWDDQFPRDCDTWRLTVDLGEDDDTAFCVAGSKRGMRDVWILRSYGRPNMSNPERAAEIRRLEKWTGEYLGVPSFRFGRIGVDEGGLGKGLSKDLQRIFGLPTEPVEKIGKAQAIRNMAGDMKSGLVHVHPAHCQELIGEWQILPWNDQRSDHHPRYSDHRCDATLYAHRWLATKRERWEKAPPPRGTAEAANLEMLKHRSWLAARSKAQARNGNPAQRRRALKAIDRRFGR